MHRARMTCVVWLAIAAAVGVASAQESRGTITGKVLDPQGAAIPGAAVVVTNIDTGVASRTVTNESGYFEVALLNPGNYSVLVEATGFKKALREGIQLRVGDRLDIVFTLQVGELTETVTVSAAPPLLETATASGGRVVDRRQMIELPVRDMNPFIMAGLAAGMQWTGIPINTKPYDNAGVSAFNTMGGVGQNEYMIDGVLVTGTNRRVGFVPRRTPWKSSSSKPFLSTPPTVIPRVRSST